MAKIQLAFIYLVPDGDPREHRAVISKSALFDLTVVGVKDYQQAAQTAQDLVKQGAMAIELCGGFGHVGLAKIVQAIGNKVPVGAVRFDCHPTLGFKSGDEMFDTK